MRLVLNKQTGERRLADVSSYEEIIWLCDRGFSLAQKHKTVAWGTNRFCYLYYLEPGYSKRRICDAGFLGIVNTELRFNPEFRLLEDTDLCARVLKRYGTFVSIKDYAAVHDRFASGGCKEEWEKEGNKEKYVREIMRLHRDIFNCDLNKENSITLKRERR